MQPVRAVVVLFAAAMVAGGAAWFLRDRGPPTELPALVAAEGLLVEGRYGEALRGLRAIAPGDLPGGAARLRAAQAAARLKDYGLALRVLDAGVRSGAPPSTEAKLLRAEALLRTGDARGAKGALAALEGEGIRTERWRFLHALLDLVEGQRDAGRAGLEALAKEGSRDPDVLLRWAELEMHRADIVRMRLARALERTQDRGPVLAALGAFLLRGSAEPGVARLYLEEAVRLRPWDRDARLDFARIVFREGGAAAVARALEEAERLLAQDPADLGARLLVAECLGERGRLDMDPSTPVPQPATLKSWDRAETEYATVLAAKIEDPSTEVRALQGLARIMVEEIMLDPPGQAKGPGTHHDRAMALLARAESLDPGEDLPGGPYGSKLIAETWYLRGRAARKAHGGKDDHTVALGYFRRAFDADPRHIDASFDLGNLCHDFFPDSPEYQALAAKAFRSHLTMREAAGLPPLDPMRMKIVDECLRKAKKPR